MEWETAMAVHAIIAFDRWFAGSLAGGTADEPPVITVMAVNAITAFLVNGVDWAARMTGGTTGAGTADSYIVRPGVVIIKAGGNGRMAVNAGVGRIALPAGGAAFQGVNLGGIQGHMAVQTIIIMNSRNGITAMAGNAAAADHKGYGGAGVAAGGMGAPAEISGFGAVTD